MGRVPVRQGARPVTRAASGAQRSGAAALIIIFRAANEYFARRDEHFITSYFFSPRAPARCSQRKIGARRFQPARPGSVVLAGIGDRTGKHLKYNGSTVLFRTLTRDARADTPAHTRHVNHQNHRTIELNHKSYVSHEVSGSVAVLCDFVSFEKASNLNRLPVLAGNKQWGGYCLTVFAASASPDQGLERATARRNFPAWARRTAGAAGSLGVGSAELDRSRENGGFPPFFEGAARPVGFASLDFVAISVADQRLAAARSQPARLIAPRPFEAPGGARPARGAPPPWPAPIFLGPLAQPVFGVSSRSKIRCNAAEPLDRNGRKVAMPKTGSGVSDFPWRRLVARDRAALSGLQGRVGENGFSLGRGRSRAATLGGEVQGVN